MTLFSYHTLALRLHIKQAILLFWVFSGIVMAQGQTIDADRSNYDLYQHEIIRQQQASSLPFIREDDVVWEITLWRTIDLREKFNQYIYFPTNPEGVHGRRCLARVIWDAVVANEIPIYEDDEFKIPLDNEEYVSRYTRADTVILEIADDDENYEYQTVLVPKEFTSEEILQIKTKEVWYIDKTTSRQHVRMIGLALCRDYYKEIQGEREFMGTITLFWVPLQSTAVRNLLKRNESYYEDNIAHLPSWLHMFDARIYESFVTRESNRMNRPISSYLTGIDALLESQRIELKLLNIDEDMWEY